MTYRAPVSDIAFALKHAAGFKQALDDGIYGDLTEDVVDAVLEEAGKFATEVLGPLNVVGDRQGVVFKDGAVATAPGWKEAYRAWAAAGWNGLAAPGGLGRPGSAAGGQRRLPRDVEFGRDGLRHRAGADHGGGRRPHRPRQRRTAARVSAEARLRRVDRHHADDRAAGRLRRRRAAHQGRARRRRQLSPDRAEDLHHLWRARHDRQHRASRAGAAARRARRIARRVAVPGAEVSASTPTARSASATTCARIRSSTRWASTARPPAPWCSATRAAPSAS